MTYSCLVGPCRPPRTAAARSRQSNNRTTEVMFRLRASNSSRRSLPLPAAACFRGGIGAPSMPWHLFQWHRADDQNLPHISGEGSSNGNAAVTKRVVIVGAGFGGL